MPLPRLPIAAAPRRPGFLAGLIALAVIAVLFGAVYMLTGGRQELIITAIANSARWCWTILQGWIAAFRSR